MQIAWEGQYVSDIDKAMKMIKIWLLTDERTDLNSFYVSLTIRDILLVSLDRRIKLVKHNLSENY